MVRGETLPEIAESSRGTAISDRVQRAWRCCWCCDTGDRARDEQRLPGNAARSLVGRDRAYFVDTPRFWRNPEIQRPCGKSAADTGREIGYARNLPNSVAHLWRR